MIGEAQAVIMMLGEEWWKGESAWGDVIVTNDHSHPLLLPNQYLHFVPPFLLLKFLSITILPFN